MASELEDLKKLRDITGAGILDCKKYLVRASNNLDEAIKLMRSEEGIKADKKSSRVAAEGVVFYYSTDEVGLLLEINSETDFVAKSDDFIKSENTMLSVKIDQFAASSIDIRLICFTKTKYFQEWLNVKDTLALEIKNIVEKNKASFAFPSTSIYVEKNG